MKRRGPRWLAPAGTLAIGLLLALAARLPFFRASDFPLNDGALFLQMAHEVATAHFTLPTHTAYNADGIPFAYPPLGFYLAAAVAVWLGVDLTAVLRYLPLGVNLLTIGAVYLLARALLDSRLAVCVAVIAFVGAPRSYEWLIMGGGLTRGLGFLWALLALAQARGMLERPTAGRLLGCAGCAALAVLTHLEMGLFVVYSFALLLLVYGRTRRGLAISVLWGLCLAVFTAPWWLVVVQRHGLTPYLAASATAGWYSLEESLEDAVRFVFPPEPLLAVQGAFAAIGWLACLLRRELVAPLWLPLVFVLTPRSAPTEATVPWALLVGSGVAEVVVPGLLALARAELWARWDASLLARPGAAAARGLYTLAPGLVGAALLGALTVPHWRDLQLSRGALDAMTPAEREALRWVAVHTPPESTFLVISPKRGWEEDYVAEWFPVLAQRKSVLTPQGAEWLPGQVHGQRVCLHSHLKDDSLREVGALERWARQYQVHFSHVYVSKAPHGSVDVEPLRRSLVASPEYSVLYDGPGGTVLARRDGPLAPADRPWPIAPDCRSLYTEAPAVQAAFFARYGPEAPWAWLREHQGEVARQPRWRLWRDRGEPAARTP